MRTLYPTRRRPIVKAPKALPRARETGKTPAPIKREIAEDFLSLKDLMEKTEKTVKEAAQPSGIFGRWLHTSTS